MRDQKEDGKNRPLFEYRGNTERIREVAILTAPYMHCQPTPWADTERVREVTINSAPCTYCQQPLAALHPLGELAKIFDF